MSSLMLLDGASLWFRSFYAIPEKVTAPDGRPVNAVRGFLDTIAALVAKHEPSRRRRLPRPGLATHVPAPT